MERSEEGGGEGVQGGGEPSRGDGEFCMWLPLARTWAVLCTDLELGAWEKLCHPQPHLQILSSRSAGGVGEPQAPAAAASPGESD